MLIIQNISVSRDKKAIIKGLTFSAKPGTTHVLLGKNGAGKSTFALGLMGHPAYTVTGNAYLNGVDLLSMPISERSKLGLFLSFQHPLEIPGVQASVFLYEACRAHGYLYHTMEEFLANIRPYMAILNLSESLLYRELNHGFSGGEKKRFELLQLFLLKPKVAILDEPDSGLDVDALKSLQKALQQIKTQLPEIILIIITHYKQLLDVIQTDEVHLMKDGCITKTGNYTLADKIFSQGYTSE